MGCICSKKADGDGSKGTSCCDLVDDNQIFTPVSKRGCTDVGCLLLFLIGFIASIIISVLALNGGNMDYLLYPQDYLGQFCGKTPGVEGRTKAFFPRLDKDIHQQMGILTSPVGFFNFKPYVLCVEECPDGYSIADPGVYGGPAYPGASNSTPVFYASFKTTDFFSRCLPVEQRGPSSAEYLCTVPACNTASLITAVGAQEAACVTVEEEPGITTAWQVSSDAGRSACNRMFQRVESITYYPGESDAETKEMERQFAEFLGKAFSAMKGVTDNSDAVLLMGIVAPFIFGLAWFTLLLLVGGFLVYTAILLLLAFLLIVTLYLYYKAGWADDLGVDVNALANYTASQGIPITPLFTPPTDSDLPQSWYAVFSVISSICVVLYVIFIIVQRSNIAKCIGIIKEVSRLLWQLPFMCVYPLVETAWLAAILAYGVVIGAFIATQDQTTFSEFQDILDDAAGSGDGTISGSALSGITDLSPSVQRYITIIIHVVCVIWAMYIVQMAVYCTLSRAAGAWFFSHGEEGGVIVQKGSFACGLKVVAVSAWCVFSRHIGSVAFGAAILTIITIIKAILHTVHYYTKNAGDKNFVLRMLLKCALCAISCLECCVEKVSYFGLIFVAIEGSSFCRACADTISFWSHYPAQVVINKMVAHMLSVVMSISIPLGASVITFIWVDQTNGPEPIWAAIAVFVMAFIIASGITDVFRTCIDTIFVCAFKDLEENKPNPKFMPETLRSAFNIDVQTRRATVDGPRLIGGTKTQVPRSDSIEMTRGI